MKDGYVFNKLSIKEVVSNSTHLTRKNIFESNRIEAILNSIVNVKGRSNILLRELFSPFIRAAVVIRRHDGTYTDPCDFEPLRQAYKKG